MSGSPVDLIEAGMTRPAPAVSPALPPPWGVAGALGASDGSGGGIPAATAPDAAGALSAPRTPARASTAPPCPPRTPLAAAQPPVAAGDRCGAARGAGGHQGRGTDNPTFDRRRTP